MPETPVEQAERMAKLEKARSELKRIQEELTTLRGKHKELLDQRREAESEKLAETKETRKLQAERAGEQRELEKRLRELNTALRQTQGLRNSLDTIAAYVPWTIEVEGEALRLALTRKRDQ
jgi:t-SNARE complex subunit (syntaxin)